MTAQRDLAEFGLAVLQILEAHDDWNGDTFEDIGHAARSAGLAMDDSEGMFCATVKDLLSDPSPRPFSTDVYRSADGTWVIHVDTTDLPENQAGPVCRVYLNDDAIHENPPLAKGQS